MTTVAPGGPRRFPWAPYWIVFGLIVVIANLPFVTFFTSVALAGAYNCNINESVASVCEIGGSDIGQWLQAGMFSFLYVFVTWPIGIVLFIVWLIVLLIHRSGFRKRAATA